MDETVWSKRMKKHFLFLFLFFIVSCSQTIKEEKDIKGMYIIGGSIAPGEQIDIVQIIDFDKQEVRFANWDLPIAMENTGVTIVNDTIYIFQGLGYDIELGTQEKSFLVNGTLYTRQDPGKNAPLNVNYKIDLKTNNIKRLPDYDLNYGEGGATEKIGDCVYKIGATGDYGANHCYNLTTNAWSERTPYPMGREMGVHGVTPSGNLLVCGGNHRGNETNKCFEYLISEDKWLERPSLPTPLVLPAYTQEGDKLHIIGGVVDTKKTNNYYTYILTNTYFIYNLSDYTITYQTPFPDQIQSAVAGYYKGKIYVVGGTSSSLNHYGKGSKKIWSYSNSTWALEPYELKIPISIPARDNNLVIE